MINPEIGFTSDVIKDPTRFVGRTDLIRDCIKALNTPLSLVGVYGKRGLGKSSLLRQIQQLALGDYTIVKRSNIKHEIPQRPRKYLTVYYSCDSMIKDAQDLLFRLCNDQNEEDGLLRLVPNDGKELVEFSRGSEKSAGIDLKVATWGEKGIESSKYAKVVPNNIEQTFRNFISSIITHQVKKMGRDGLLIILDEFDVIENKENIGSLIKALSSDVVKFAICGIGRDLTDLVEDHASVERLLEEGAIHVKQMPFEERENIITTAEYLFKGQISFVVSIKQKIAELSQGYPYLVQLIGKECVNRANFINSNKIDEKLFGEVLETIATGNAFPTLESQYQRAIGNSEGRQLLLHLLADQPEENTVYNDELGKVFIKNVRPDAEDLKIENIDQLLPRLIDKKFGPVLNRIPDKTGTYEFVNPVFRVYVKLRKF